MYNQKLACGVKNWPMDLVLKYSSVVNVLINNDYK